MTTTQQQQQKRRCFHWVHIFVYGLFFGWYYHANETSSAVPLNSTMYLIVSFYASGWGVGGGRLGLKEVYFRRCISVEGLIFTLPRIPQEIQKFGGYSSPSDSIPWCHCGININVRPVLNVTFPLCQI